MPATLPQTPDSSIPSKRLHRKARAGIISEVDVPELDPGHDDDLMLWSVVDQGRSLAELGLDSTTKPTCNTNHTASDEQCASPLRMRAHPP